MSPAVHFSPALSENCATTRPSTQKRRTRVADLELKSYFGISNDVGLVKGFFFCSWSLRAHFCVGAPPTPLGPTETWPSLSISCCVFTLFAQPVSVHQLGGAHQPSLQPLWTMMSYSNSLPLGEAGSLISFPVTRVKDHSPLQASPHEQHRSSVASGHGDRTLRNQSDRAT
jgi:hypothetical protein